MDGKISQWHVPFALWLSNAIVKLPAVQGFVINFLASSTKYSYDFGCSQVMVALAN